MNRLSYGFINFGAGPPTVEWGLSGTVCDCGL
jgi:hypothetical protein